MFGVLAGHLRRAQLQLQREQTTDLVREMTFFLSSFFSFFFSFFTQMPPPES